MKAQIYQFCDDFVSARIHRVEKQLFQISEALKSETKSSAGDKHETGRAMMQLEREKLGNQLWEAEKMRQELNRIDINSISEKVRLGSLVKTNINTYFISVSAGKFQVDDEPVFCVSVNAPISRLLLGKSVGDSITLNNVRQRILQIDVK